MTDPAISPDLAELRLLAQLSGIAPSRLAAAVNNPEFFSKHLSVEELGRYVSSVTRLLILTKRIGEVIDTVLDASIKAKERNHG